MKSFKYIIAATLLIAAGCGKDNDGSDIPGDGASPETYRISRIYAGNYIIKETKDGDNWTTLENQTDPLALLSEFTWSGDTLKTLNHNNRLYTFKYDSNDRIVRADAKSIHYVFTYNPDGNLSKTTYSSNNDDGTHTQKTIDYTWGQGRIKAISYKSSDSLDGQSIGYSDYSFSYAWGSEDLYSCHVGFFTNDISFTRYTCYYVSGYRPNPLYGFIMCLDPDFGLPYSDQCYNALNPYIPFSIDGESGIVTFNRISYKPPRMCSFTSSHVEMSDNDTKRTTTGVNYKIEFVQE